MTRRRRAGCALVAAGSVACVLAVATPPAGAQPPVATGWWSQLQADPLPLPLPVPIVPEGGIMVQQGATAPLAYGALRYEVAAGSASSLTLTAAVGSTTVVASLQACRTSAPWTPPAPGSAGAWAKRAAYGFPCAPGIISSDNAFVAFHLGAEFVENGALDVAIVPTTTATPFSTIFEKPSADSLVAAATVDTPPTETPTTAETSLPPLPNGDTSYVPPSFTPSTVTVSRPEQTGGSPSNVILDVVGLGDPDRRQRAFGLGGAAAIIIGWWLATARSPRAPRLLGALAAPASEGGHTARTAGIGRFSRPRATKSPGLR